MQGQRKVLAGVGIGIAAGMLCLIGIAVQHPHLGRGISPGRVTVDYTDSNGMVLTYLDPLTHMISSYEIGGSEPLLLKAHTTQSYPGGTGTEEYTYNVVEAPNQLRPTTEEVVSNSKDHGQHVRKYTVYVLRGSSEYWAMWDKFQVLVLKALKQDLETTHAADRL